MVELKVVIFILSIEILVDVIFAQSLKATSREKMAQPSSYGFIATRKLYYVARLKQLRVLALTL